MSRPSSNSNHSIYNQSTTNNMFGNTQNSQSYQHQENVPQPQKFRRESLVKPTWQNVCPGEVPFDTLEKLNKLCEGEQQSILMQQQVIQRI